MSDLSEAFEEERSMNSTDLHITAIWNVGKRYFLISLGIYLLNWVFGIFLALTFVSQTVAQQLFVHPTVKTDAWYYIGHNLEIEGILLVGALTLGVGTFLLLAINGLLAGIVATTISLHYGVGFLLVGLLPHGIPESLAWILTGTCSFMMSRHLFSSLFQTRWTKNERKQISLTPSKTTIVGIPHTWKMYGMFVGMAAILIVLSGILEAYVSPFLLLHISR